MTLSVEHVQFIFCRKATYAVDVDEAETADTVDPAAAMQAVNLQKTLGAVARAKAKPLAKALQEAP